MIAEDILEGVKDAVKEVMKLEHIFDYDYEIDGKSECGNDKISQVVFVKVKPQQDSSNNPYNFVVKLATRSEDLREKLPVELLNNREIFLYSEVFPNFRKFVLEKNNQLKFDFVPHTYWIDKTKGKETAVFDNLTSRGFKLYDSTKPWTMEHSRITLKHYGKLHALSLALKDQKPELFDELKKNLGSLAVAWSTTLEDLMKMYQEPFDHVMNLLKENGRKDLVDKYSVVMDEIEDVFHNKTEEVDEVVICHMDYWNNNFLFKYEREDEISPSEVRILDFQLSLIDSPVKDLSYNIYANCDKSCLNHFEELLETYHDSLTKSLKCLGCQPEKFLSMKDLRRHWRKYGIYGIFLALNMIKIELSIDSFTYDSKDKVKAQEEYDRRILEVYLHFGDNFL